MKFYNPMKEETMMMPEPTEPIEITITVKPVTGGYELLGGKVPGGELDELLRAVAFTEKQAGRRGGEMIQKILAAAHVAPAKPVAVK